MPLVLLELDTCSNLSYTQRHMGRLGAGDRQVYHNREQLGCCAGAYGDACTVRLDKPVCLVHRQ